MVNKEECILIFNEMIRGTPIPSDKIISLISDYLTRINYDKSDKIINLIIQNPQLIQQTIPKIVDYYCRKYTILSILNNNFKTILYYE